MAKDLTSEQVESAYMERMGPSLGPCQYALYKEVAWLHAKWNEYHVLFGTNPERVDILNQTAGFFFKIVQEILWDDILLHISRLTDPVKSSGKRNLTIRALPELLEGDTKQKVTHLVSIAVEASAFAREHRKKRLAHKDLLHATDQTVVLIGLSRADIERILAALRNVMNTVDRNFKMPMVMYQEFIRQGGADALLAKLLNSHRVAETAL